MIRRSNLEYSTKVDIPRRIIHSCSKALKETFQYILEGYLHKSFRVTVKCFLKTSTCRITVIFNERPAHPEAIDELVAKVADRTVKTVRQAC